MLNKTNIFQSKMLRFLGSCLIATSLMCSSFAAHAWGYDGHRVAADIATGQLSVKTKVRLNELMPGVDLADIASYMDEERNALKSQIPGSEKWHYNNIPICESASDAEVCPNGNCATARIDQLAKLLADRNTDQNTRIFAVKALVHLIADIHQPLHAADNHDHGGNNVDIGRYNLHGEWDSGLLKKLTRGQSVDRFAADLGSRYRLVIANAQNGTPEKWASESHELARKVAYGMLPGFSCGRPAPSLDRLPSSYYEAAMPVVESQLAKAGARIAYVLNWALGR